MIPRGHGLGTMGWRAVAVATMLAASLAAAGCGDEKPEAPDSPAKVSGRLADLRERLGADAAALDKAGCTITAPRERDAVHVKDTDDVKYTSNPPSSGEHFDDWAPFGFYDEPVEDGYVIHNLEHGGVSLAYGKDALSDERLDIVRDEVLDDGEKWIVVPDDDVDGIAAVAWGMHLACEPAALEKLEDAALRSALDAWYEATESRGTEAEKDVPPYAGAMSEPRPDRDISQDPPESFGS